MKYTGIINKNTFITRNSLGLCPGGEQWSQYVVEDRQ